MLVLFQTAVGDFDLSMYNQLGDDRRMWGIWFHIICIACFMLLILNLLIAIMSDTYALYSDKKEGLYLVKVIQALPHYRFDPRYGVMICAVPPFNVLVLPLLPFLMIIKDEEKLIAINAVVLRVYYTPIAIIAVCIFLIGSLLFVPFAFCKALFHKCVLFYR